MKYKVFISHKNEDSSNGASAAIGKYLKKELGYTDDDLFFDKWSLQGGMNWNQTIIDRLLASEVVIVILSKETVESDWVQREIDMARARKISILPVTINTEYKEIEESLKRFDLQRTQFVTFPPAFDEDKLKAGIARIASRIEPLAKQTLDNQQDDYDAWHLRRRPVDKTPAAAQFSQISFRHPLNHEMRFHIATGDSTDISGYEVLVNTENNYMQMARFFEKNTLSWSIRTKGANFRGERLVDDTIQTQLYAQAREQMSHLPVPKWEVLVTGAGHEESELAEFTTYRYIFHTAAVEVMLSQRDVMPVGEVNRIIKNCIDQIYRLDRRKGEVATSHEVFVAGSDDYQPIKSIVFPAFGAGKGGKSVSEAAEDMIGYFASKTFIDDVARRNLALTDVGFSVFFQEDIDPVNDIFTQNGFESDGVG